MIAKKDKELADYVKEQNEKYNQLLQKNMDLQDTVKDKEE